MKNKIFSLFGLFLVATLVTSCEADQDVSPIVSIDKPTMTIDFPTAVTVSEGDVIPFTITLSEPVGQEFKVYVVLDQPNSTADGLDSDVDASSVNTTFEKVIVFPAFTTTLSDVITINNDDLAEPTEVLKLTFGETRTSAVTFEPVVSTITINNVILDDLVLDFHFDKEFNGDNGYKNTLCEFVNPSLPAAQASYDVDFVVYNAGFIPVTYPGSAGAQTGACTESLTMSLADYPDGLYHITAYLYTNGDLDGFPALTTPFNIPITVDYLRSGSINKGTFTQEAANWFTSESLPNDEQLLVDVLVSTVAGVRKFTVQDTNGNISATGKSSVKSKHVNKK